MERENKTPFSYLTKMAKPRKKINTGGRYDHVEIQDTGEGAVARGRLLDLLVANSYRSADTAIFQLASGKRSTYYIDCKATTVAAPEAMPLIGAEFLRRIPREADAVGGLTLGADPIAYATAYRSAESGRGLPAFIVRKESKNHGLKKCIEGCPIDGLRVVIVDDVVTTGGSTIEAIRKARDAGGQVIGVLVLVDRQQGGMAEIEKAVGPEVPVEAIFTRADLENHQQSIQRRAKGEDAAPTRHSAVAI